MKKILLSILLLATVYANEQNIINQLEEIYSIKEKLHILDEELKDNITIKNYKNYQEYLKLKSEYNQVQNELQKNRKIKKEDLELQAKILENKLNVLSDYENYNTQKYLNLPKEPLEKIKITNIYSVIEGLAEKKKLRQEVGEYEQKLKDFAILVSKIDSKAKLLDELSKLEDNAYIKNDLTYTHKELNDYKNTLENITSAFEIYKVKIRNDIKQIDLDIKKQYDSATYFCIVVVCIFLARYLLGFIIRKYVDNKDNVYSSQKILNIFTFLIISLFSIFYFVENISYLISVLGFASAGLAIAMKDMFMSILGWVTLQFGGGFRVGDRIRVSKNGVVYVGDVIDISLLNIIIYEDITFTTFMENRRAGRLIYVPNNYIFTDLISNYNYSYLKTVWDGIDICLEFSSNIDKAKQIILEAAQQNSSVYADSARKSIQKMRNHYQMKNSGTDARIYVFLETYCVKISVWYMANSREALKIRSLISEEIIKKLKECNDIKLAFPSQTLYLDRRKNQPFNEVNNENIF